MFLQQLSANKMSVKKKIFSILIVALLFGATICLFWPAILNSPISKQPLQKDYVQLLFTGDIMLDRGIRYYAENFSAGEKGNKFIFDKISPILKSYDLVITNLEGPITSNKSISSGTTPGSTNNYFFTFDPSWAKTLFEQNIRVVNLGNNHILNFGRDGLAQTKKYLDEVKVGYFGSPDYPKSTTTKINGVKITFVSYNEFSAVPEETKSTVEEIKKTKDFSDIIIVFCHWGVEYSLEPTEEIKNMAHQFVDAGADLIIGSHPHVIEPMEEYNGKRIYYSLGNFIFDQYFSEDVRNGLGVGVKIIQKLNEHTFDLEFTEKHFYLDNNGQTIEKD